MRLSFRSRLEKISSEANYFGVSVPLKITKALGTKGPVQVSARVNDSMPFLVSLFPIGGGRHYIRVKAKIRNEVKIKEGDRVQVQIDVLDPSAKVSIPKDLLSSLRMEGLASDFDALPTGKKRYILRQIDEAAKPETRVKRIHAAVEAARQKK